MQPGTAPIEPPKRASDHCFSTGYLLLHDVALSSGLAMLEIVRIPTKLPLRRPHIRIHTTVLLFPLHV